MALRTATLTVLVLAFAAATVSGSPAGSDFTIAPDPPTAGQPATFTFVPGPGIVGTPTVDWDFGGGAFDATGTSVTHTYGSGGSRTVRMRVTDDEGAAAAVVVTKTITVSPPPNAAPSVAFSFQPTSPLPGAAVSFSATGSDPNGDSLSYSWSFGDGGTSTAEDPKHTYSTPGTRTVTVTVSDGHGGADTASKQITVQNRLPSAAFDFSPPSPLPGETVLFSPDVSDPDGDAVTVSWNFGSGSTKTGSNSATYATPGTRVVTLTATDSRGGITKETREITVRDPAGPVASFVVSPGVPLVGQAVTFANTSSASSGSITSVAWDLDDDGEFDDSPASWSFGAPGNKDVWLRVTQTNGNSAVTRQVIRVNAPPSSGFVWTPTDPAAGRPIDFFSMASDAEGSLAAQAWDLDGDGQFDDATGASARRSFRRPGVYDVGLQVTDSDGAVSTVRRAVAVAPAQLRFIAPFPVVRLSGKLLPRGALVKRLAVRAPKGSLVRITCKGAGCPVRAMRKRSTGRALRFKTFERRLRAGITLQIFVRQPGAIGKYTRFRIRAGSPPVRTDRCLFPGKTRPRRCP